MHTMSTTRQIAHNTIIQMIGKVVTTALGLLAIAMMTRYLGVEKFGWYVTAISFLQFAGILIDFGLIPVTAQMLGEGQHDRTRLFQNLLAFRFVTAFVCLCVVPLIALFFPYPHEVKVAIALSTVSFFAISINQILTGFFQTELKMHLAAFGEFIGRVVLVAGLWLLIHFGATFLPIMMLIALSTVAYTLVMLWSAQKYIRLGFQFDPRIWRSIIVKMWPITLSIIFNVVYLKGDILLLSFYRTQQEVGMYGAAYRVIDIVTQIAMLTMGILLPLLAGSFARGAKEEFKANYERAVILMLLLGIPLATGMFVLAEPIMALIAGADFASAAAPLQILSLAVFGLFLGAIYGHTAVALNRQKQTVVIYISAAIFTLAGYLLFIPRSGMIGAAWMSVFSELYVGVLLFIMIHRFVKLSFPHLYIFKIIVSTAIMGVVIYFFKSLPVLLTIGIGGVVYVLALIGTKAISKKTIQEIFSF